MGAVTNLCNAFLQTTPVQGNSTKTTNGHDAFPDIVLRKLATLQQQQKNSANALGMMFSNTVKTYLVKCPSITLLYKLDIVSLGDRTPVVKFYSMRAA